MKPIPNLREALKPFARIEETLKKIAFPEVTTPVAEYAVMVDRTLEQARGKLEQLCADPKRELVSSAHFLAALKGKVAFENNPQGVVDLLRLTSMFSDLILGPDKEPNAAFVKEKAEEAVSSLFQALARIISPETKAKAA